MKNAPVKAKEAHADYEKLLEVLKLGRMAGALLGQQLFRLFANEAWRGAIGEGTESWADFLKMPEINLEVREANRAMEIYEEFCVKRGYSTEMLAEAGTKTLHYLLPLVKRNELPETQIKELLQAGATLPQRSFRKTLHEAKGGTLHYEFVLMRRCIETNDLQKVHDYENDKIIAAFPELQEMLMPEII